MWFVVVDGGRGGRRRGGAVWWLVLVRGGSWWWFFLARPGSFRLASFHFVPFLFVRVGVCPYNNEEELQRKIILITSFLI